MKTFVLPAGQREAYLVLEGGDGLSVVYEIQSSARKVSVQLARASAAVANIVRRASRFKK